MRLVDVDQAPLSLQTSELLAAVLAASPDIVIVIDAGGVISFANEAVGRVLGYPHHEWLGQSVLQLIHPDDLDSAFGELTSRIREPVPSADPVVLRIAHSAGHWVTVEASGIQPIEHPDATGMVVVVRDITSRLEAERHLDHARQQLAYAVSHDPLTRLPNRRRLESHLEAIDRPGIGADNETDLLMVKVVDVDALRIRYGVDETEAIVRALGEAVLRELGVDDFVAVSGVGEFVVVVDSAKSTSYCDDLARRLLALADTALSSRRGRADVRLAVGMTTFERGLDATELIDRLGQAARWGAMTSSGDPVIFDRHFTDEVAERSRVALDVERGLAAGEFELHYQPIRCLRTGRLAALEGLLRWRHPEQGLLTAGRFLPTVEGTAVMVDIGDLVVAEACTTLARWQHRFGPDAPSLAINVSARQLRRGDFAASVKRALAEAGADPTGLGVELTETHALEREPRATEELRLLREFGVQIALDDFGTGYSSLHHLQKIRADVLKIDRSFIENLGYDEGATAIVRAAIDLAEAFGTVTVAEGVTTRQQHQMLRSMGCKQIQGYLVAPALAPACADRLVAAEHTCGPAYELDELRRRVEEIEPVTANGSKHRAEVIQLSPRSRPMGAPSAPRVVLPGHRKPVLAEAAQAALTQLA